MHDQLHRPRRAARAARLRRRDAGLEDELSPDSAGRSEGQGASVQGWAIVENQTDNDWNNVQLSLVSGRPISFIQDLYQPLYIPRPVVQPELYASLRPQTYEAGMAGEKKRRRQMRDGVAAASRDAAWTRSACRSSRPEPPMAGRASRWQPQGRCCRQPMDADCFGRIRSPPPPKSASSSNTPSATSRLPRQKSAMLPIITDHVEVEKLSIYNASVLPKNPLNGARVKNTTDKHLLQGPITVLEAAPTPAMRASTTSRRDRSGCSATASICRCSSTRRRIQATAESSPARSSRAC